MVLEIICVLRYRIIQEYVAIKALGMFVFLSSDFKGLV